LRPEVGDVVAAAGTMQQIQGVLPKESLPVMRENDLPFYGEGLTIASFL
jgi:hypothetical protein